MATEKEMNQSSFIKIAKEINAYAEVIRSRQDQKQVIIDDFNKERKRYKAGKISRKISCFFNTFGFKPTQRLTGCARPRSSCSTRATICPATRILANSDADFGLRAGTRRITF